MTLDEAILANQVALRLDTWEPSHGCPAWIDSADRQCGRPNTIGYLCKRHHTVAVRRLDALEAKAEKRREEREAYRAENLPRWRELLDKVGAEIERSDPPRLADRAAYTGHVHKSLRRQQSRLLSDSNVKRMAELWRRHDELTRKIGRTDE